MQFALAADPGEVAGGARATAHQLTVRILPELVVADGVMTQVLLAAAPGAAGLQDQYLRREQRLPGIQVAAGQGRAETLGNGDGRLRRGGHVRRRLACAHRWGLVVIR